MPYSGRTRLSFVIPLVCCICACSSDDQTGAWETDPIELPQVHRFPEWSANGDSLYYIDIGVTKLDAGGGYRTDPDSSGLRIIPALGGTSRMVMQAAGFFTYSLSPDGGSACFSGGDVFIGDFLNGKLDPTTLVQVTRTGGVIYSSWSPTGDWISFDTYYNDPRGALAVWKIRPDGSEMTDLSVHGAGEWLEPSWDATGTKIVHVRYVTGTGWSELFIMDSDGTNGKRLTNNDVMDLYPHISPDCTRICYERWFNEGPRTRICTINMNGSGFRALASGQMPVWSPDGAEIAYVAATDDPRTNGTIWVMKADGSHKVQLTRSRLH